MSLGHPAAQIAAAPSRAGATARSVAVYEQKTADENDLAAFPSAAFRRALEQLTRFARSNTATVLIEGESGTGKTLLARHMHAVSPRRGRPFQQVVLSTLDDSLAGSELFGHVPGAYTDARHARLGQFASANTGTLFLDEIAKASKTIQQKLLHVVEYGEFRPVGADRDMRIDTRLIAATNVSLDEATARGEFLPDLNARLSSFVVRLPPLRERRADIPLLVKRAVRRHSLACGYSLPPVVDSELLTALQGAPWPYNLRQLDAAVHRIVIDADGAPTLTLDHCQDERLGIADFSIAARSLTPERIASALATAGSVSGAARLLKVARSTLLRHQHRNGAVGTIASVDHAAGE